MQYTEKELMEIYQNCTFSTANLALSFTSNSVLFSKEILIPELLSNPLKNEEDKEQLTKLAFKKKYASKKSMKNQEKRATNSSKEQTSKNLSLGALSLEEDEADSKALPPNSVAVQTEVTGKTEQKEKTPKEQYSSLLEKVKAIGQPGKQPMKSSQAPIKEADGFIEVKVRRKKTKNNK